MPADPAFHNAVRAAQATVDQIRAAPVWSWRSTGDPGIFEIWTGGEAVGTVCLLPGHVNHRAVLMDSIIDYLNHID